MERKDFQMKNTSLPRKYKIKEKEATNSIKAELCKKQDLEIM